MRAGCGGGSDDAGRQVGGIFSADELSNYSENGNSKDGRMAMNGKKTIAERILVT
jgi:hypothetical protein